ncbi:MAG TPA: YdcF family protein [Burkholderiales bacterium]|nr:YdcF family protein [Burkholderiales bacterium]
MELFPLRHLLATVVLPPNGPFILAFAGLLLLNRRPRLGRALAWFGLALLLALATPAVSQALLRHFDQGPALDIAKARDAQAVVILGGGIRGYAPEYGGPTVGRLTLDRVRYGARVARKTGVPVLVSGGIKNDSITEAQVMQQVLLEEFGVTAAWTEQRSRNTRENARLSAEILLPQGIRRVALVAHEVDMSRARAEFEAAGFEVIPAPTMMVSHGFSGSGDLVPDARSLLSSYYALYEILGNTIRRVGL